MRVSLATFQEVCWLDQLVWEPGAFYLMDRAYVDWARLYAIEQARGWAGIADWKSAIQQNSILRYMKYRAVLNRANHQLTGTVIFLPKRLL